MLRRRIRAPFVYLKTSISGIYNYTLASSTLALCVSPAAVWDERPYPAHSLGLGETLQLAKPTAPECVLTDHYTVQYNTVKWYSVTFSLYY